MSNQDEMRRMGDMPDHNSYQYPSYEEDYIRMQTAVPFGSEQDDPVTREELEDRLDAINWEIQERMEFLCLGYWLPTEVDDEGDIEYYKDKARDDLMEFVWKRQFILKWLEEIE